MVKCDGWCTPLYIYLVLAVMSLIATIRLHFQDDQLVTVESIVMSVLYKVFWAGVIYLLCASCHENWAWIILLLPLIFIVLLLFLIFGAIGSTLSRHNLQQVPRN